MGVRSSLQGGSRKAAFSQGDSSPHQGGKPRLMIKKEPVVGKTMVQTKMATETEVEGNTTVSVPPAVAEGLAREQSGENQTLQIGGQTASAPTEDVKTEQESQEVAPQQEESAEAGEAQPTRKERRIGEFVDKLKDKDKELSALREQLETIKGGTPPPSFGTPQPQNFGLPPWEVPQTQPGAEISPEQYQQQVVGAANTLTDIKLRNFTQNLAKVDAFKDDLHYVESQYDVLNPDKPDAYDKSASKKITELYRKASAGDPSLRLKDFVDNIMSFRQEGRNEGMKEITPKVIRQQAEGAIPPSTPSGRRSGEVNPDTMTQKEMEQYLKDNGLWDQ